MAQIAPQRYQNPYTRSSIQPELDQTLFVKKWEPIKINQSLWVNRTYPLRKDLHHLDRMMSPEMKKEGRKLAGQDTFNKYQVLTRSTDGQEYTLNGCGRFVQDGDKSAAQGLDATNRGKNWPLSAEGRTNTNDRIYLDVNKKEDTKNHMFDSEGYYKANTQWMWAFKDQAQGPNPLKLPGSEAKLEKNPNTNNIDAYYHNDYDNRQGLTFQYHAW